MRLTPELSTQEAYEALNELLTKHGFPEVEIVTKLSCEPLHTPNNNTYVQTLTTLAGKPEIIGAPWFCDAAVLASEGNIPSVAAGPGSIEQAHTADEWIKEKDLQAGADFYQDFLMTAGSKEL